MDPARYRDLFVREASRRLDAVERAFAGGAGLGAEAGALLRDLHTLKGMSATMGVASMVRVAHAAEELCERVRDGQLEPRDEVVALLAEGLDRLRNAVAAVEAGREPQGGELYDERVHEALRSGAVVAFRLVSAGAAGEAPGTSREARAFAAAQGALAEAFAAARGIGHGDAAAAPRILHALRALHEVLVGLRAAPFGSVVPALRRHVRAVGERHGHPVDLGVRGEEVTVDEAVLARLVGPLSAILTNAVVHGMEAPDERRAAGKPRRGRVAVAAERVGSVLVVTVEDDGRGVDPGAAAAGRSTHAGLDLDAGRGLGLEAARQTLDELGGSLRLDSVVGRGTRVRLQVPVPAELTRLWLVEVGGCVLGVRAERVEAAEPGPAPALGGLGPPAPVALRLADGRRVGVDRVLDDGESLVVAPPWPLGRLGTIGGTTVAPDGRIACVVEP